MSAHKMSDDELDAKFEDLVSLNGLSIVKGIIFFKLFSMTLSPEEQYFWAAMNDRAKNPPNALDRLASALQRADKVQD